MAGSGRAGSEPWELMRRARNFFGRTHNGGGWDRLKAPAAEQRGSNPVDPTQNKRVTAFAHFGRFRGRGTEAGPATPERYTALAKAGSFGPTWPISLRSGVTLVQVRQIYVGVNETRRESEYSSGEKVRRRRSCGRVIGQGVHETRAKPGGEKIEMGHFLMVALGSSGDVNPFLGIALRLRNRGHETTLLSAPCFSGAAEAVGADFAPLGTAAEYDAMYENPDLWHPRRGLRLYFSYLAGRIEETVQLIETHHDPARTVVLAPFQCFGARVAQEALGVPLGTVLPYPISLQSAFDPNRTPIGNPPGWMGRGAVRLMYRIANWEVSRHTRDSTNTARRKRGLAPPIRDVVRWSYSPHLILGLWPSLFSSPQPDWPPQAKNTGFLSYDGPASVSWTPPPDLPDREDWLVFTPGSQMTHGADYFLAACEAASRLNLPTLMVAPDRAALPRQLPKNIHHLSFAPFSWLFSRATAVVHHGGIGTAARAMEAGLPQLIVPRGFDQFDNAHRVRRIGAGTWLDRRRLSGSLLHSSIRDLLEDQQIQRRCREIQVELSGTNALDETCSVIEELLPDTALPLS